MFEPLHLAANYKIAIALLSGMMLGFLLVKSDLAWRESWLEFFLLRSGRVLKTLLMIVLLGTVFFFFARLYGLDAQVRPAYFWTSLVGGVISGTGFAMAGLVPLTAVASLAAGRFYAIAAIAGMLLAIPVMHWMRNLLSIFVDNWAISLPGASTATVFFAVNNPAVWVCGTALVLLALVHYTLGEEK